MKHDCTTKFSLHHSHISISEGWEIVLFERGNERVKARIRCRWLDPHTCSLHGPRNRWGICVGFRCSVDNQPALLAETAVDSFGRHSLRRSTRGNRHSVNNAAHTPLPNRFEVAWWRVAEECDSSRKLPVMLCAACRYSAVWCRGCCKSASLFLSLRPVSAAFWSESLDRWLERRVPTRSSRLLKRRHR